MVANSLAALICYIMDLMRFVAGDPRWCFARVTQDGQSITKQHVREGGEGMGPVAGDRIMAQYGFDKGVVGTFGTHRARDGAGKRFGLHLYGSKGIITLTTGSLPAVYFLQDPSWSPGHSKAAWQEITSEGLGKPEPLKDASLHQGNVWIAKDLIESIEQDRQPLGSMYDGRAALEMILATYESHRRKGPVEFPLENRKHPLTML